MSESTTATPHVAGSILTYYHDRRPHTLHVGSPGWYRWLRTATMFTYTGDEGTFTARRLRAGKGHIYGYWRAYRTHAGAVRRMDLGRTDDLTCELLSVVAVHLAEPIGEERRVRTPRHPVSPPSDGAVGTGTVETAQSSSTAFPPPLTSLVGREREIREASALLLHSDVRELTLTGTGGVGKTRLALAIAGAVQSEFPGGICCVSLAAVRDSDLVLPAIAQAEGLLTTTNQSLVGLLQALLPHQRHLLVLDNFEQVIAAAPSLVELLAVCPQLKMLVTSREVLRVQGERQYLVQPLALPDPEVCDDETLAHFGAVALFLERARDVRPELELNAASAPLILEICRRLDGLPLAIELAAARLSVLSLPQLLERLERRLQVLTGGPRDLPTRQQTLRRTIDWSYGLLSQSEQRFLRLLSVFEGGCTLEAAEVVLGVFAGDGEGTDVLDAITSLLDKHLLYRGKPSGEAPRFLMHETLREYGREALTAKGEVEKARQAHAEYYLGLARTQLETARAVALLEDLQWEYANVRAALHWALEKPASEVTEGLQRALFGFWQGHRRLAAGRTVVESTLVNSQAVSLPAPRGALITPPTLPAEPERHQPASTSDAQQFVWSLYLLGIIAWIIGDFPLARLYTEQGLARARTLDDKITYAYLLDLLGQIALDLGDDREARTVLEEGLAVHRQAGDTLGSLNALFFLERALCTLDDVSSARAYAEEHLALARAIGFQIGVVGALIFLGRLALEEGDATAARALFDEGIPLLYETDENLPLAAATNLSGIGVTLAKTGRAQDAVRLWAAASSLCASIPEERALVARSLADVRARLGAEAFAAAWAQGQTMTLKEALAAVGPAAVTIQSPAELGVATSDEGTRQLRRRDYELTEREVEVLRLVAQGLSDAQLAEALVISPRTVNAHLRSIYRKLHISSRHQATYFALEHGLI